MDKRTLTFGLCFLAFCGIYGVLARTIDKAPRDESWFWVNKIEWGPEFDVVFAGDSRVNRGVWPQGVERANPDLKMANFGFSGQGWSDPYLDAIPRLLRPGGAKAIVLGITPRSFTQTAVKQGDFKTWSHLKPINQFALRHLTAADSFIRPENPVLLFGRAVSSSPKYGQWHTEDGWMPGERSSHDTSSSEAEYRAMFQTEKADPARIEALASRIASWKKDGIQIFIFVPPIEPVISQIEREMSGYSQEEAEAKLTKAGAQVLKPEGEYKTFDGHHLDRPEAVRFSDSLGQSLAAALSR
jgi:hypothetical protein